MPVNLLEPASKAAPNPNIRFTIPKRIRETIISRSKTGLLFSTWHLGYTGFPVIREYYRCNNSKLKTIDYYNVKSDFSEFEDSRKLIREYEFAERWDHWLIIGGIALFASGIAIEPNPDKAGLPVKTVLSTGSLSFFFGAGFWMTKGGYLNKAVHNYFANEKKKSKTMPPLN